MSTTPPRALTGIKIIDMTSVVFGPLATQMLGDLGADVIKVESPDGDMLRAVIPYQNPGMGAAFLGTNRNKRSVVLDLKTPEGREQLLALLKDADVFVSSIRPNALARLSLSPEVLRELNPKLITVAAVGFGSDGPYADKPAYDDSVQSVSGMAGLTTMQNPDNPPAYAPTIIADKLGGVTAAHAITTALFHRERTGEAQHVEVPMFETLASFLLVEHMAAATFEDEPQSFGYKRMLVPHRRPVQTKDGYITILPYSNAQWARFFTAVGREEMLDHPWVTSMDERSANIGGIYDMVAQIAPERTTADWITLMEKADIPAMPVRSLKDLPQDPHLAATGFFQQIDHPTEGPIWTTKPAVKYSATPARYDIAPVPKLGEHNEDILNKPKLE
ncbi:CoA transferase [Rhodobacterales bacterium 52_120_T64]|nr:CoA transferase [Rhodobacterales bacterium 52_120_T64]